MMTLELNKRPKKSAVLLTVALSITVLLFVGDGCNWWGSSSNSSTDTGASRPNIIMIVVDTLRADHLSTYGYTRNTDPHIAEFSKQAVIFKHAIAPAPWTLPSFTSILESKLAYHHDRNSPLDENTLVTIPLDGVIETSYLQSAGYKTVSIQTNLFLNFLKSGKYFDEMYFFDIDTSDQTVINWDQKLQTLDHDAAQKAIEWLESDSNTANQFFLFIGLISPHWDYKTDNGYLDEFVGDAVYTSYGLKPVDIFLGHPSGYGIWTYQALDSYVQSIVGQPAGGTEYYEDARLYIAGYDSEIKYSDHQIGDILQALKDRGLYDNSMIIITGDHGENMADHDVNFSHGNNLYQSLLHVPLLIKLPGQMTQQTVTDFVRTIDIFPTVFNYANIDYIETDGKSLLPVINGEGVNFDERPVISYRIYSDGSGNEEVSVIKDGYKLIRNRDNNANSLYFLKDDPSEKTDLSSQQPDTVHKLKDFLSRFFTKW